MGAPDRHRDKTGFRVPGGVFRKCARHKPFRFEHQNAISGRNLHARRRVEVLFVAAVICRRSFRTGTGSLSRIGCNYPALPGAKRARRDQPCGMISCSTRPPPSVPPASPRTRNNRTNRPLGCGAVGGRGETSVGRLELAIPPKWEHFYEGDLDGGPSNSEKRDARVNISQTAKWLERSPPKSYPRPWRGKLARRGGWATTDSLSGRCPGTGRE
jgi:hypothetical protein